MDDYQRLITQNNMLNALVKQQGSLIAELKEKLERKAIDNQNLEVRVRLLERNSKKDGQNET